MDIVELSHMGPPYSDGVYRLLAACDKEFVPPLSNRTTTMQHGFTDTGDGSLQNYFDSMAKQAFLVAVDDGEVVSFLSYQPHDDGSCYVTAVCTGHSHRNQGIASSLYDYLENRFRIVTIRTWSTNDAQMSLLSGRGYHITRVLFDDRGPEIDTVYLAKNIPVEK